jgi:hypothetical protein
MFIETFGEGCEKTGDALVAKYVHSALQCSTAVDRVFGGLAGSSGGRLETPSGSA